MSTFLYYFDGGPLSAPPPRYDVPLQARTADLVIRFNSKLLTTQVLVFADSVDSASIIRGASATSARDRAYFAAFVAMRHFAGYSPQILTLDGDHLDYEVGDRISVAIADLCVNIVGARTSPRRSVARPGSGGPDVHPVSTEQPPQLTLSALIELSQPGTLISFGPLPPASVADGTRRSASARRR